MNLSMNYFLKKVRSVIFFNKVIRILLIYLRDNASSIIDHWPAYGKLKCNFNRFDFFLYNNGDDGLVNYFYYNKRYYEENDLKVFTLLSKKAEVIIDIGANTGIYSILASKSNPNSLIYSFEPYISNSTRLKQNVKLNNLNNIKILEKAIGDKNGIIKVSVPDSDNISDVVSVNKNHSEGIYKNLTWKEIEVPSITLDSFQEKIKKRIELIKCDVETFEKFLLRADQLLFSNVF
jgi:FkbM family methyltransferase